MTEDTTIDPSRYVVGRRAVFESLASTAALEKIFLAYGLDDAPLAAIRTEAKKRGVTCSVMDRRKFTALEKALGLEPNAAQGVMALRPIRPLTQTWWIGQAWFLLTSFTIYHGNRWLLFRHRRREEQRLPGEGHQLEDALDVGDEAHVEHAVGLVDHHDVDAGQHQLAALEMVEQPAGRCDQHINAAREQRILIAEGHAADQQGDGQAVLVRSVAVDGIPKRATTGPGRLSKVLGVDRRLDGQLADLFDDGTPPPSQPLVTPRVGISKAVTWPRRWLIG